MVTEAITSAHSVAGANPADIAVCGDSAYCAGKLVTAVVKAEATFSFSIARNRPVEGAIAAVSEQASSPVRYPGTLVDPDTGDLVSNAQVAECVAGALAPVVAELAGR
ncbi:hypothetical protein ACQSSU_03460 [Micromonospora echinospora]